jgi:hypothetical protein
LDCAEQLEKKVQLVPQERQAQKAILVILVRQGQLVHKVFQAPLLQWEELELLVVKVLLAIAVLQDLQALPE